jgi:hypothetical protein
MRGKRPRGKRGLFATGVSGLIGLCAICMCISLVFGGGKKNTPAGPSAPTAERATDRPVSIEATATESGSIESVVASSTPASGLSGGIEFITSTPEPGVLFQASTSTRAPASPRSTRPAANSAAPTATRPPRTSPTTAPIRPTATRSRPTATLASSGGGSGGSGGGGSGYTAADAYPCNIGQIKANVDSGIYHVPGQQTYAQTRNNVICFDTESQAIAAGYRRAKR